MILVLGASRVDAQSWGGLYVSGLFGSARQADDASETVAFDTGLDGTFTDTVRTSAGADAFSPGFCGGLAVNATAAGGCTDDESGVDLGGRVGVDWQRRRFVAGVLVDVTAPNVKDSVTAFSTTPASYSFTRELHYVAGFRGRVGFGSERVLAYGTVGPAWGRVEQTFTTSNRVNTFVAVNQDDDAGKENVWGYQAGAGVEVKEAARVSVTGEYLLTSLDNRDQSIIRSQGPAPATNPFVLVNAGGTELRRTGRFETQSVRVGVTYRF